MSLQPLAWWPERTIQLDKLQRRSLKHNFKRSRRKLVKYLRNQYYLFNGLTDARCALKLNEDIILGCLIIMAVLTFAATSVIANIVYNFVMAASVLSTLSGFNLAILTVVSVTVVITLGLWLAAFLHNSLTYSLYEGAIRKQLKSLRKTLRYSLRYASQTTVAWLALLIMAVLPGGIVNAGLLLIVKTSHLKLINYLSYIVGVEVMLFAWAVCVVCSFGLLPQVALFENHSSWTSAARRARQLVGRRGRMFALSAYLLTLAGLGTAYLLTMGLQSITHTTTSLCFVLFAMLPLCLLNASMTMLYRKRRLARS